MGSKYIKQEYNTIDFMRFIFAVFIVGIHTNLLHTESSIFAWLFSSLFFRTGVPFFFIVSGYFLSGKLYTLSKGEIIPCLRQYLSRYNQPLIVWGGVGLLFAIWDLIKDGRSISYIGAYSIQTFFYPLSAMWYLLAIIIGSVIVTEIYLHFKNWKIVLIIFSTITYIFVLLCNNYAFLIEGTILETLIKAYLKVFVSARNGVFLAPVFLGIGFLIRDLFDNKSLNINIHTTELICIASFVLLGIEAWLLYDCYSLDDRGYFISQLIFVPSLVVLCLCCNMKLKLPYKLLRRLSVSIYFMQYAVKNIITHFTKIDDSTPLLFFMTLCITIIIALISYRSDSSKLRSIMG